jgi:glycosyl transferase family 25
MYFNTKLLLSKMWEFVDRIVYINLDKRTDRNKIMTETVIPKFEEHLVTRFSAVENTNGAVGCYLSHIQVLQDAINLNVKNILILEDDISWNRYDENYEKLKEMTNRPYDVIMLGGTAVKANGDKVICSNCSHSYLVNGHYIQTLLNRFKEGLEQLINTSNYGDYALDQYWKPIQQRDNWLIMQPCMLYQLCGYSDIEKYYKEIDFKQSF